MALAMQTMLDDTKTRKHSGVATGSFRPPQHPMVEVAITFEQAHSMAIRSAARPVAGDLARASARSGAMVKIIDSARRVGQGLVRLHRGTA